MTAAAEPPTPAAEPCPNPLHDHPLPSGYIAASDVAEQRLRKRWANVRCPDCGLYGWRPGLPLGESIEQVRDELGMVLSVGSVRVLRAVYPLIAARVRAEAVAELCEALGEPIETPADHRMEPPYRMTWDRAIGIVRGRTTVWSDLLSRAQVADADWLNQYRGRAAGPARASLTDRIAEAVADERQRIVGDLHSLIESDRTPSGNAPLQMGPAVGVHFAIEVIQRAAGPVPVATPEPTECASLVSSYHDDEDVSRCGGPANAEWFSTAGEWQPICARHSEGVPAGRLRSLPAGPVATPTEPDDPTYGRIDPDIQRAVDALEPESIGSRVAMENTLQARRDAASPVPAGQPVDEVVCPTCGTRIRARMSDTQSDEQPEER